MTKKHTERIQIIFMLISGFAFFFLIGNNTGYVLLRDSDVYINTSLSYAHQGGTMPGYIAFINVCKLVFQDNYLIAIPIIQGLIAISASFVFTLFIQKEIKLSFLSSIIIYLLSFLPYCYSLPEEVATHEILTEPLTLSIFYYCILLLLLGIYNRKVAYIAVALVFELLMILMRKQAILFLPVILYFFIFCLLKTDAARIKLRIITLISILLSVLAAILIFVYAYPTVNTIAMDQVLYSFAGKTIYMAEESDISTYQDDDERNVFELLYEYAAEGEMTYEYAERSDDMNWQHAVNGFNYTTRTVWKNVITYCRDNGMEDRMEPVLMKNVVLHQMRIHPDRFIKALYIPLGQSLISSIFIKPSAIYGLCAVITAVLYIFSIVLFIICRNAGDTGRKAVYTYIVTMAMLLINVIALNILFQSLQRYVVYTWGMFYISVYLMLLSITKTKAASDGL